MGAVTASAVEPLASAVGDRPSIGDNGGNRQSGLAMPASAGNLRIPVAPLRPIRDSKQRREHVLSHRLGPGPTAPRGSLLLPVSRAEAMAMLRHPGARSLVFTWLSGCAVVPAALAGPYASELHTGPVAAGLLMAAVPAGAIAGAATFTLLVRPAARLHPLSWLAAVSSDLLTVVVMRPPLWLVGLARAAAGGGAGYQAAAAMTVVRAVPATDWARAADLAEYGTAATQALVLAAAAVGAPVGRAASRDRRHRTGGPGHRNNPRPRLAPPYRPPQAPAIPRGAGQPARPRPHSMITE